MRNAAQRCLVFCLLIAAPAVAADPSATSGDVELLARAHDHAGDAEAAAAVRAGTAPLCLEEGDLGFLDFPAKEARP